jgi:hypothetical protein
MTDYERAKQRISETPSLWPFEAVLLANWGDPDFYGWVATAEVEELISWAEGKKVPGT